MKKFPSVLKNGTEEVKGLLFPPSRNEKHNVVLDYHLRRFLRMRVRLHHWKRRRKQREEIPRYHQFIRKATGKIVSATSQDSVKKPGYGADLKPKAASPHLTT